jgi:adenylate kinase
MPDILILMGPQGAGKGTQAQMLAEKFSLPIVATGDMLREVAKTESALGQQVKAFQASGDLVSDDILVAPGRMTVSRDIYWTAFREPHRRWNCLKRLRLTRDMR